MLCERIKAVVEAAEAARLEEEEDSEPGTHTPSVRLGGQEVMNLKGEQVPKFSLNGEQPLFRPPKRPY